METLIWIRNKDFLRNGETCAADIQSLYMRAHEECVAHCPRAAAVLHF